MSSSLDSLAKNISNLREISKFFPSQHLPLLSRKGVFPYDFVSSWEKLNVDSLPPKEAFHNKLTQSDITDEDYKHAQNVWNTFQCKTLGDYSDIYLKTDVLLLADVFETFRDVTIKTHKLDPCHYYTLPSLSWDAMLRFTGVELELLQDYEQVLMIENGIRGGICQVSHRYLKANNKYLADYDPNKESTFISYQDCNNLYGYAMVQPLPYGNFEWISVNNFEVLTVPDDGENGYILDVDVEYPSELHQLHNDLPFLPENIKIGNVKKLVPHFNNRKNYIVHFVALKQALNYGLKPTKINRILKFSQSTWFKPYIEHNTRLRTLATSDFEKDLYKLYNNSVYGKTMENIRKRTNIKLVCTARKIQKLISKPQFIDRTIYDENLAAVHMAKTSLLFDKPIYVGMSILDISKVKMYEYHYDIMLPRYTIHNLKLAYIDTDSFIYLIKTDDLFNDMLAMLEYLDTSDYPPNHPCFSVINKKVLGKFKDETKGALVSAFVGLRAKMYAIIIALREIKKVSKKQH